MLELFHTLISQPLYNILIFLYNTIPGEDFGIAIVATTLIIKFALVPLSKKQIKSQKQLQDLQPEIKKIQEKHKNDKEKQTKALMEFYSKNKVNPFSGCFPLIVQLIFLIAIYRILINISLSGLVVNEADVYSFVTSPEKINHLFLGLVDLTKPSVFLAVLAAISQYFQAKMLMHKNAANLKKEDSDDGKPDFAQMMSKQMLYLGPVLTLMIGLKFPAGLALYWLTSTVFTIIQQGYVLKKNNADTKSS